METRYPTVVKTIQFLFFTAILFLTASQSSAQLQFRNPVAEISTYPANNVGASYRFANVTSGIDAIITIDSLVNGSTIVEIDQANAGFEDAFQPKIQAGSNTLSYAVFTVRFVKHNTNIPEFLMSLTATNLDLDGNTNLKELCEFNMDGGVATFMNNSPQINVVSINKKFFAQNVSGIEYSGIDTTADAVMFKVRRDNITQFSVRLGAISSNNGQAARQYSVYMKDFVIDNATSLPLTLLNFDATLKKEKVQLNWATTEHKNFSHFILQRSTDARNFTDVMTLMTELSTGSSVNLYNYEDNISGVNATVIYYRLQLVDANEKNQYSPIRMIRLNAGNKIQVQTFPNPATTELRVQIPNTWQEKAAAYEIFNTNGALVSRVQVARAVQIQQLNVQSLGSGNYIIRVTSGQEVSTSKFIKY